MKPHGRRCHEGSRDRAPCRCRLSSCRRETTANARARARRRAPVAAGRPVGAPRRASGSRRATTVVGAAAPGARSGAVAAAPPARMRTWRDVPAAVRREAAIRWEATTGRHAELRRRVAGRGAWHHWRPVDGSSTARSRARSRRPRACRRRGVVSGLRAIFRLVGVLPRRRPRARRRTTAPSRGGSVSPASPLPLGLAAALPIPVLAAVAVPIPVAVTIPVPVAVSISVPVVPVTALSARLGLLPPCVSLLRRRAVGSRAFVAGRRHLGLRLQLHSRLPRSLGRLRD